MSDPGAVKGNWELQKVVQNSSEWYQNLSNAKLVISDTHSLLFNLHFLKYFYPVYICNQVSCDTVKTEKACCLVVEKSMYL